MTETSPHDTLTLRSRQRWFWIAFAITIVSPLAGIILGTAFSLEEDARREGKMILALAVPWLIISLYLLSKALTEA